MRDAGTSLRIVSTLVSALGGFSCARDEQSGESRGAGKGDARKPLVFASAGLTHATLDRYATQVLSDVFAIPSARQAKMPATCARC